MNPIPTTIEQWRDEVREGYEVALAALGEPRDDAMAHACATGICAHFRGFPQDGAEFDAAYDCAMGNYDGILSDGPELIALPQVGFAFAYLASHLGYGLIPANEVTDLMSVLAAEPNLLLPVGASAPASKKRKAPAKSSAKQDALIALTTAFCTKFLNEEYASLCKRLAEKAGRKRVVPFESGKLESWAAGVVHAICSINFGFDKTQTPNTTVHSIVAHFGVSQNTASQKSKALRDLFKMEYWDSEFGTAEMAAKNPMNRFRFL